MRLGDAFLYRAHTAENRDPSMMAFVRSLLTLLIPAVFAMFPAMLIGAGFTAAPTVAPNEAVALTAERTAYQPSDTAVVILVNRTRGRVWHNLCIGNLERRFVDGWFRVTGPLPPADPAARCAVACQSSARALAPDSTARLCFPLPDTLSAGTYRITTTVEAPAQGRQTATPT